MSFVVAENYKNWLVLFTEFQFQHKNSQEISTNFHNKKTSFSNAAIVWPFQKVFVPAASERLHKHTKMLSTNKQKFACFTNKTKKKWRKKYKTAPKSPMINLDLILSHYALCFHILLPSYLHINFNFCALTKVGLLTGG